MNSLWERSSSFFLYPKTFLISIIERIEFSSTCFERNSELYVFIELFIIIKTEICPLVSNDHFQLFGSDGIVPHKN